MNGINVTTRELPAHLAGWQLPNDWSWGSTGVTGEYRHAQEVVDALGRSLALVTAPNPDHYSWLAAEARRRLNSGVLAKAQLIFLSPGRADVPGITRS